MQVAGVLISKDAIATGVATGANLFSIGMNSVGPTLLEFDQEAAIAANYIATLPGRDIRAINMSFTNRVPSEYADGGNSLITQFVDWSAAERDILYVVGGNQGNTPVIPPDNFNGITVAASEVNGGIYSKVASFNTNIGEIVGQRTFTDILAPGKDIRSTWPNNMRTPAVPNAFTFDDGTSLAAPHVTGTIALQQQYADERILNSGNPSQWNVNARQPEVMKAVLMNSADKIKDDKNSPNYGKYLGMERTVLKQNGDNWFDSVAHLGIPHPDFELERLASEFPLDEEMGAGHLNAKRALQQFIPGEQEVNGNFNTPIVGDVPLIGWDYGTISGPNFPINKYVLDTPLEAGNFISITLAWNRKVDLAIDDGVFSVNDTFVDNGLTDLDLYLVPAGTFDIGEDDIAISESKVTSVEHIFTEIPEDGDYEIWVFRDEQFAPPQDYGIAWWYGLAPELEPPLLSGDFDNDNDVDGADFLAWQRNPSVGDLSNWESEFGMTSALVTTNVVPEPTGLLLVLVGLFVLWIWRVRRFVPNPT